MKLAKIKAFTLAEILVVITIIGLVVAIVLPSLYENYLERQFEQAKKVFVAEMRSTLKNMDADDELAGYDDTMDFVRNGLSKHMKLTKICDNSSLKDCFAEYFLEGDGICGASGSCVASSGGISRSLSRYVRSGALGRGYNDSTVGIVTVKGVSAIVTYDPDCEDDDVSSADGLKCVGLVYDVNGKKAPNTTVDDIGVIGVNLDGTGDCKGGKSVDGICFLTNKVVVYGDAVEQYWDRHDPTSGCSEEGTRRPTASEISSALPSLQASIAKSVGKSVEEINNSCFATNGFGYHGDSLYVRGDGSYNQFSTGIGGCYVVCVRE